MIDSHLHLDQYNDKAIEKLITTSPFIDGLISVSMNLTSAKRNLLLSNLYNIVKPAFGFHPEQSLPNEQELEELINWMAVHQEQMVAVGEVGLPFYLRQEKAIDIQPYIEMLETFIKLAKQWDKPIVLHAVYDDAPIVCDLLEKNSIEKAHFHWFKGDDKTIDRLIRNNYFISVTPDIVYEEEIQKLAMTFPLSQMMVETDGPWPFEGPFQGMTTHPEMMHESISIVSRLKNLNKDEVYHQILQNTKYFYSM